MFPYSISFLGIIPFLNSLFVFHPNFCDIACQTDDLEMKADSGLQQEGCVQMLPKLFFVIIL